MPTRLDGCQPWREPRGKWMVSLVNSHTNATLKMWHLWEIDLRFALNSTPGWVVLAHVRKPVIEKEPLIREREPDE